jgi:hypothetical protein
MGPLNDRLDGLTAEGWEPIMMSGDNELYIMLRRPRVAAPASAEVRTAEAQEVMPISDED